MTTPVDDPNRVGFKRVRIFTERDLRATRLEMAVIDTAVFQRLRYVQQLGQSATSYPTAEHSRFPHSLGTLYWATKMLAALHENYFAVENRKRIAEANEALVKSKLSHLILPDVRLSWFEQLVRLGALTHDITHLPFGHTLEDQAELLPRHDEDPERIRTTFNDLIEEAKDSQHLTGQVVLQKVLEILLRQVETFYLTARVTKGKDSLEEARRDTGWGPIAANIDPAVLPYLTLASDIVGNTICADLIDYVHRDTAMAGMSWSLDKIVLAYLKILQKGVGGQRSTFHLGVSLCRKKLRHDVITAILALLRARYDLAEKVYYHHAKCAADALLEKIIRGSTLKLDASDLIRKQVGNEGMLALLQDAAGSDKGTLALLKDLRRRRLPKAIYRLNNAADWSVDTLNMVTRARTPDGRAKIEREIAEACDLPETSVIVSCLPRNMQLKQAKALIEWTDGELLTLDELPASKHYLEEVRNLTDRYRQLWCLTVYSADTATMSAASVERACIKYFNRGNDALLAAYLRQRQSKEFEIQELVDVHGGRVEKRALQMAGVAAGGGRPEDEVNIGEIVADALKIEADAAVSPSATDTVAESQGGIRRRKSGGKQSPLLERQNIGTDTAE